MEPQELYTRLGRLVESPPRLDEERIGEEARRWLAQAFALVNETGDVHDIVQLRTLIGSLTSEGDSNVARHVMSIVYRALAVAELRAPAASSGAFIGAGNAFDALMEVGKVLRSAERRVRIVDPYLDENALSEFAGLAAEAVEIQFLADPARVKPAFAPALRRWKEQYRDERPVDGRLTEPRALHDRLLIVDDARVWVVSQSLRGLAAHSPASIVRLDTDMADLKLAAYESFWQAATPVA